MTDAEKALEAYRAWRTVLEEFIKNDLEDRTDYMKVRRGDKPSLLQPGAQKLAQLLGLSARFEIIEREIDLAGERDGQPFVHFLVKCFLYDANGIVVSESYGEANSRSMKFAVKSRGKNGKTIIDPQEPWRTIKDNSDTVINTVLKIAQKRAYVGAVTFAAGISEMFTQDIEDYSEPSYRRGQTTRKQTRAKKAQPAQKRKGAESVNAADWTADVLERANSAGVSPVRITAVLGEPLARIANRLVAVGKTKEEMDAWFDALSAAIASAEPVGRNGRVYTQDERLVLDAFASEKWPFSEKWDLTDVRADDAPTFKTLGEQVPAFTKKWFAVLKDLGFDRKKDWDAVHALFGAEHFSGTDVNAGAVWYACVARTPAFENALKTESARAEEKQRIAKMPIKPSPAKSRKLR